MRKIAIIGAGPIGIYLSTLLVESEFEIHLFESGDFERESPNLDMRSYEFMSDSKMPESVHRLFGGANFWKNRVGEFLEKDFDSNGKGRYSRWPFPKKELLPGYENASSFVKNALTSDAKFESDFRNHFSYLNRFPEISIRIHRFANSEVWRESMTKLISRKNFHLHLRSFCTEVKLKPKSQQPVVKWSSDSSSSEMEFDDVVVVAGTFQSTALLMRSKQLDIKEGSQLGLGLMDHIEGIVGRLAVYTKKNKALFKSIVLNSEFRFNGRDYGGGMYLNGSQLTYHLEVLPLQENHKPSSVSQRAVILKKIVAKLRILIEKVAFKADHYSVNLKAEEYPNRDSRLYFDELREKLTVDHKISESTLRGLRNELLTLKKYFRQMKLGRLSLDPLVLQHLTHSGLSPNWHPMGTTRMGIDENSSVVDSNLALHKHKNIYVVSASVFPTGSNCNPTFTAMALAYRLSKHINKREV